MADCRNCLFYTEEQDELKRRHDDILVIGAEQKDNHYCFAFSPIPDGVFEGQKECPQYQNK